MDNTKTLTRQTYKVLRGYASEDLASDSVVLKVICPELTPNAASGTVGPGITTNPISLKDRDGNPVTAQVTTANHLVATWEGSTNSRYAPMVRKGEPVEVYRTADQDHFYWRPTGNGRDYRTTDRLHMEIGATDPTKPGVTKDDTNTYSAMIDSDRKKIYVKSSKANGEPCAWSFEFDTAAGTFHVCDDSADPGNRIFLDSGAKSGSPVFQANLASGAVIKLEKDDGFIKLPKKFLISAGERIVFDSPIIVLNINQVGAVIINAANLAINTAKDVIITAGGVTGITAASTKIGGMFVAANARIANAVKGVFGSGYNPVKVQKPQESSVQTASNSPDTSMTGPPYTSG